MLVHRSQKFVALAADGQDDFIDVPFVPRSGACRRRLLAILRPNFNLHFRTVSQLAVMSRATSIFSIIRKLSGKRGHSHTAVEMTSAG